MFPLISILTWPISICLWAWTMLKMWGWFILPTFGFAAPSFVAAAGLVVLIEAMTKTIPYHEKDSRKVAYWVVEGFLRPLIVVLIGWGIVQFMP